MVPLAKVSGINVSIDLANPVNELVDVISIVTNSLPGRQEEILEQLDLKIGEAMAEIQRAKAKAKEGKAATEESQEGPARSA
ncbi:hypothetical protein SAMN04487895_104209 [Paenibacillus sophorae]|uniref:Uncharacterized protein n=1 Tax=Paenibacillus sophorae TaxID=1333845 RepID=A0A1H8L819_9BACL|nr:hypothetical protein SAMN04487895_104209 [Paenibacillus sophorae]